MNYHFTSLKWKFSGDAHITYLYDTRLPYSAKSSPEIFHHFMQSVRCMMAKERVHWSHSLLWWFSDHWGSTWVVQTGLWYASTPPGGPGIYHQPTQTPNSACTLLGSAIGHYCLHNDIACHKTSQTVGHSSWISKQTARKQNQLQHLASKLSKACQVVYGGQQILNTVNSLSLLRKFKLDGKFCSDIMWGVHFLKVFKGTWLFLDLCKNLIVQPWQLH